MCGILLVKSQYPIDLDRHKSALQLLRSRGPDDMVYRLQNNIFVGQTVLSITGGRDFYHTKRASALAFNGEIYNYQRFGTFATDTELAYQTVNHGAHAMHEWQGPWAWVWTDFTSIAYATDPQGEKCLYRYQDDDILIVSSELAPIQHYIDLRPRAQPYVTKHWPTLRTTPWQGVERVAPGVWHDVTGARFTIDSLFRWRQTRAPTTLDEAVEEFSALWQEIMVDMRSDWPEALTFSAGVDTGIILATKPDLSSLYTVVCEGKDMVSPHAREFISRDRLHAWKEIMLKPDTWADHLLACMRYTRLPAQSWSWVGQWAIAQTCQQRILFTGVGADELFGGYPIYQTISYDPSTSHSPYSRFHADDHDMAYLWYQCLEFYSGDAQPATMMMDYLIQIGAVDLRGVDLCTQAWGIEPRSPFVHPRVIKFALNLPWHLRQDKIVLKEFYRRLWPGHTLYPKQGFTGHCNDSYDYLGISIDRSPDRQQDWQQILQASYHHHIQSNLSVGQTNLA